MNTHILQGNQAGTRSTSFGAVSDWAALIGRIALALMFVWSGYGKLADISSTVSYMSAYHMPFANVRVWPAALLELIGGLMLITGWQARFAALALAGFSIVSAVIFHNFWAVPADQAMNQAIHFMKNVTIMGGLLQVFAFGPGRYAVER